MAHNSSPFPASQQDIARLKQTAIDAVNDLSSSAGVHVSKAKGEPDNLAGHMQEEGGSQLQRAQARVSDFLDASRDFVAQRPFTCLGAALALGFFVGLTRRQPRGK